jgi:D-lyxose ketol-isomerase
MFIRIRLETGVITMKFFHFQTQNEIQLNYNSMRMIKLENCWQIRLGRSGTMEKHVFAFRTEEICFEVYCDLIRGLKSDEITPIHSHFEYYIL